MQRPAREVLEGQRVFDLVVWFDEEARNNIDMIRSTLMSTPDGSRVALVRRFRDRPSELVVWPTGPDPEAERKRKRAYRKAIQEAQKAGWPKE